MVHLELHSQSHLGPLCVALAMHLMDLLRTNHCDLDNPQSTSSHQCESRHVDQGRRTSFLLTLSQSNRSIHNPSGTISPCEDHRLLQHPQTQVLTKCQSHPSCDDCVC